MRTTLTALALSLATAAIAQPMPRAANCLDRVPASAAASAPGGNTPYACRAGAGADAPTDAQIDAMLMSMQAMHDKMLAAKTYKERQALMAEHRKVMHEGFSMMRQFRGPRGGQGGMGAGMGPGPGAGMGPEMMGRRMEMMELMMQMMIDRETPPPATNKKK